MNNFDYFNSLDAGYDADPNWCPDCGEPRGVCMCQEYRDAYDALYDDDENPMWIDQYGGLGIWEGVIPEFDEDEDTQL